MKRILVFSTDDHLYPAGGAEQAFGNITERLSHIEFDLICARLRRQTPRFEKIKNVSIYRVGFGIPKLDGIWLALFGHLYAHKLMKRKRYDLIWSIMATYGAFAAVRVKQKTNLPFLLTLQEGDSLEYIYSKVRFVKKQFNAIFERADAIQAISRFLLNWGREMGYHGALGTVIPNGVNISAFTKEYPAEAVAGARASFGFAPGSIVLITSSRLEIKNGIIDVIEALPTLPQRVCFVICGSGSLEASLKKRIEELGLTSRVKFMGFVQPKALPLLFKASDIFIRPSHSEGLGNAFLEAMASGLITVGTNAGGIADFLRHNENGFMVEISNPKSVTDILAQIIVMDESAKANMRLKAFLTVQHTYDWEVIAKDMESLFNTVCTQSS